MIIFGGIILGAFILYLSYLEMKKLGDTNQEFVHDEHSSHKSGLFRKVSLWDNASSPGKENAVRRKFLNEKNDSKQKDGSKQKNGFKQKNDSKQKGGSKQEDGSKKWNVLDRMSLALAHRSKRSFWYFSKQKQLLVLYSKNLIFEKFVEHVRKILKIFLLSLFLSTVILVLSEFHAFMILNLLVFPSFLAYKTDVDLKNASDKYREEILSQCPELFYQISILMSSGSNIDAAISNIRESTYEEGGIKYLLDKIYFEIERGESLVHAVNMVAQNLNIRAFNKFSVILKQVVENGMKNATLVLMDLSDDTLNEIQNEIREKSEKLSSKMMMPLMVSLICVMIMLAIPVMLQM